MIGRLRGTLVGRSATGVLLDVARVGYEIQMTPRDLAALPSVGEEVVLHTHLHVREDVMALYGFDGESSRDLFRILLGTSGVGPSLALAMLAALRPSELRQAVATEDISALTTVSGVGKRTAQKLILDLRPKLGEFVQASASSSDLGQVREALESLGYAAVEIREVLADIPTDVPLEDQVRSALQSLGRR